MLGASGATAPLKPPKEYLIWAHDGSDLKPDPRVVYGVLPNGMRYALMKTNQPAGAISLRLRIAAGAKNERDDEQGIAHYLEHIAFQGSDHLKRNELVQTLQRLGLAFGADTNAETTFDYTLYQFDLPANQHGELTTGLNLLREIASRLTITQDAIDAERGVILSEERMRGTAAYRAIYDHLFPELFDGMWLPKRLPIGKIPVINSASAKLLRGFYERYYRPERALLIVTGAMEPAAVEAQIKTLFGDWAQPGPKGEDPDLGVQKAHPLHAVIAVDPTFNETVRLSWFGSDPWLPDSKASRAINIRRAFAMAVVNERLFRHAHAPDAPFASAGIECERAEQTTGLFLRTCQLAVTGAAGGWQKALAAAEQDLRQAVQFPPDAGEVAQELRKERTQFASEIQDEETANTREQANFIASAVEARAVFMHSKDIDAVWEPLASALTPNDIHAALSELFGAEPKLIFAMLPKAPEGGERGVLDAYRAAHAIPVSVHAAFHLVDFPYNDFGAKGTVKSRHEVGEFGVTQVVFNNGVRLNIRPSDTEKDNVKIILELDGGRLTFDPKEALFDSAYCDTFILGGLKRISFEDVFAEGSARFDRCDVQTARYALAGHSNRSEAKRLLQIMAAYLTDPAFRAEALVQSKRRYEDAYQRHTQTPTGVLQWELETTTRAGDLRWANPTPEQAGALSIDQIKAKLQPALAGGALEVTVVGDTAVEETIAAVAETLGALPQRREPRLGLLPASTLHFPTKGATVALRHNGRPDQALVYDAWPGFDQISDHRRAAAGALVASLLKIGISQALRDKGIDYSPDGGFNASSIVAGFGYLEIAAEPKPENIPVVESIVDATVAEILAGKFSDDALARAREPLASAYETNLKANIYWLFMLSDSQSESATFEQIRTQVSDVRSITRAELVAVAKDIFHPERKVEIRIVHQ